MRSTQLQTLRAVEAGADTVTLLARELGVSKNTASNRVSWLQRKGFMDLGPYDLCNEKISLTDRARALLERRAQLDGETMT